ncbi:SRPBCC family protein [Rhodanobacter lindaniclasticus]|uniref:SRPBCC family protein n=1 Tax=Rhodanobacter lindaniclasticus TaxID=75310 RepID=UPI00144877D3|nr:SRPBCC family protein [Rhodanobacter lindaniclasticus]
MNPGFKRITTLKVDAVLEIIAIAAAFMAAAILILAATRTGELRVERSRMIRASPRTIFDLIDDLKAWEAWTPYDSAPDMQKTYSSPARGQGATYSWMGNRQAKRGSITIIRSIPYSRITLDLKMARPFPACGKALFSLIPQPSGTQVIWALDDRTPYAGRVMGLFVNLDRKVGDDLELGLTRLKHVAETTYQPGMNIIESHIRACIE